MLLLLFACTGAPDGKDDAAPDTGPADEDCASLVVDAEDLAWTDVAVGVPAPRALVLTNDCVEGPAVTVEATTEGAAFTVSPRLASVAAGEAVTFTVTATLTERSATGTLTVVTSAPADPLLVWTFAASASYDQDGDGFEASAVGGEDCDDTDATVFPGATDAWYDGIDADCAGDDDHDQDADGSALADDCDDTDPTVHPGATDAWYDGVDADCDGNDDDQDGDGAPVADDCDDTDPTVFPGADDAPYDGLDADCAGDDDFDADGDTFAVDDDCDDTDATVFPGAADAWYDGVDSDCAGDDDFDADGDGHGLDDCDDTDAAVHPDATEGWYDGVDGDCDGASDFDQDGDGLDAFAYGGEDCADTDAATAAGPAETENGVDDDCDGFVDEGFVARIVVTEVMFDPAAVDDTVGEWIEVYNAGAATVDLVGWEVRGGGGAFTVTTSLPIAPGAYAVLGAEADPTLNGGAAVDFAWTAFSLGDADTLYLVEGGTTVAELTWDATWPGGGGAALTLDDDHLTSGAASAWCAAAAPYGDGDLGTPGSGGDCWQLDDDGDGHDLADCDDDDAARYPAAPEVADGVDQDCNGVVDEAAYGFTLPMVWGTDGDADLTAAALGDFDGDGLVEVVAVEWGSDEWRLLPGAGYRAWSGRVDDYGAVAFTGTGSGGGFAFPMRVARDLTGDGVLDLAYGNDAGDPGFAILAGPFADTGGTREADVRFAHAEDSPDRFEGGLQADGDFDGDGVPELVYANAVSDYGASGGGTVAVFESAALVGTIDYDSATVVLLGAEGDAVGSNVAAGDVDGDGYDDLAIAGIDGAFLWRADGFASTGPSVLSSVATATLVATAPEAQDLALVDADGDGALDLVRADIARDVRWYLGAGALSGAVGADAYDARWAPPAYGYEDLRHDAMTPPWLLPACDIDGDGVRELGIQVTTVYAVEPLFAWFGADAFADGEVDGAEALAAFTSEPFDHSPVDGLVGDLDGDGAEELVLSDPGGSMGGPSSGQFVVFGR